jgi:hypothetical protein
MTKIWQLRNVGSSRSLTILACDPPNGRKQEGRTRAEYLFSPRELKAFLLSLGKKAFGTMELQSSVILGQDMPRWKKPGMNVPIAVTQDSHSRPE